MPARKTASKQSKKVELDFDIDEKAGKKVNKELKRTPIKTLILLFLTLLIGLGVGAWPTYFLTRNDCFELIGEEEITLTLNDKYLDSGVRVIAFNKDDSKKVKISTNLDVDENGNYYSNEVGTFYIAYTVDNFKYGTIFKIQKIRLITFVEPSEDDNLEETEQQASSISNIKEADNG